MAHPRLQKQLVAIPLTSGLSQREDPAWLPPGQAITITNYIKGKQSTLEKSPGYTGLGTTTTANANVSYVAAVASHKGVPLVVATDTSYGPALYSYSDSENELSIIDRVSEVFIPTPQMVFAFQQPISEYDCAVIAPLGTPTTVLHVCAVDISSSGDYRVYYAVTDYTTKAVIIPPQEVTSLTGVAHSMLAPKIVTCMGTGGFTGVTTQLILLVGASGTNSVYASTFNPATFAWSAATAIITDCQNPAVFDASLVDDDSSRFVVVYENSSARHLTCASFNSATLASVATGTFADTTWSSGSAHITGFACRASVASGALWLAYAWSTGSGTSTQAFVRAGAQTYPALSASFATSVDLTNGIASTYPGPQLLDIKEINQGLGYQQVVWSPPTTKVGYDPAYVATPASSHPPPLTAIYQSAYWQTGGAGQLLNNQPRWTNGVTLASRMYPYQLSQGLGNANANNAGQCFVVGFMPSNNLNPTWSGVATVTTPTTSAVTNVPYAGAVTFSGGRAYGGSSSGGAQAQMVLSDTIPTSFSCNTNGIANLFPRPYPPDALNVANVAVTQSGSGYTSAPTAALNWGVGANFSIYVSNPSGSPADGVLTAINVNPNTGGFANGTITINIAAASGNTANLVATSNAFTAEMVGLTVNVYNCANANDNQLCQITSVGPNGVVCSVTGTNNFINETLTPVANVLNNQGRGFNYSTQPNAVPVWVEDTVAGVVYTNFATATVVTSGTLVGQITSVSLTNAGANANIHTASVAWVPQPTVPIAANASCYSNVSTTLVSSSPYENVQGSFYLFSMDTFADFVTPNDTGTPYRNTPMRLVASLKPRLGLNAILSSAHSLPHISQSWRTGSPATGWGAPVFDLPINVSPTSVGIMQFQPQMFPAWALNSPMYQGDELGGLTAMAAGQPTLTDGSRAMGFSEPYFPENLYAYASAFAPGGSGNLYPGSSYQYIATYERMDTIGNTHRSGRSVPVELVTLPTYDDSRYTSTVIVPTMGFSPAQHGTNTGNLANVATQPPLLIQLYRTSSPGSTDGGTATTGGTIFYNQSANSQGAATGVLSTGVAQNDLWSPYVMCTDGILASQNDPSILTHPELYGDGSNGTDPGSTVDSLCPPALQGIIVHKNRYWGFEGSNVWYTKAFTSGEGPGFNEQMAFSVDDGSGDITALASMDERLLIFKRDRIFYVVGDGPNDNLSSNDLQPPQRIQSDVGAINQASVIVAPSGVYFLSDDGLYQVTRKFDVAHYGSFVDDTLTTYPVVTSGTLDRINGRLVWIASKTGGTGNMTPGAVVIMYSYLWDAWTIEQLDQGGGAYTNFQVTSASLTGTTPTLTLGGNYANTGGPFVLRESANTYTVPNSAAVATYQQSMWQSPWLKAQDFQGFARWMLVTLAWYNSDTNQLQVQFDYNYGTGNTQTFTVSAAAMLTAQKAGSPYPTVQWEFQPNFAKAESFRVTITDMKDSVSAPVTGKGSILLGVTITMGLKDGTKTYPVPVTQRGSL